MPRGVPGPVKKTAKTLRKRLPNSGSFSKENPRPGPGRPLGVINKFTGELKTTILDGMNSAHPSGLTHWVRDLATDTPTSAAALLGRLIPISMDGKVDVNHTVTMKYE